MKKNVLLTLCIVLALVLIAGCGTAGSSTLSETPSSEPASSIAASSEELSSADTASDTASAESAVSVPETSEPEASQPETSVPEVSEPESPSIPATPASEGFDTEASAKMIAAANEKRAAAGLGALEENARLNAAAQEYCNRLAAAGVDFLKSTDFKTLPDGTKVTSLVNALDMDAKKMSGINYSVWINEIPAAGNTADALVEKAVASAQFSTKVEAGFSYIGAAAYTAVSDAVPQYTIVVVYYAGGAY